MKKVIGILFISFGIVIMIQILTIGIMHDCKMPFWVAQKLVCGCILALGSMMFFICYGVKILIEYKKDDLFKNE